MMHLNRSQPTALLCLLFLILALCACSQDKAPPSQIFADCDAGDGAQCHSIALLFSTTSYTYHNTFLIKGCDRGHAQSCKDLNTLALITELSTSQRVLFRSQDFIPLFQSSCDEGYLTSCARLAAHLLDGSGGLTQDIPRAESLFLRALSDAQPSEQAAKDIALSALSALAYRYQSGTHGAPQDLQKSIQIFTQLCDIHPSYGCEELMNAEIERQKDKGTSHSDIQDSPEILTIRQRICDHVAALKQQGDPLRFQDPLRTIQNNCTHLCLTSFYLQERAQPLPIPTLKIKKVIDITRSRCELNAIDQDPSLRTEEANLECQQLISFYNDCAKVPNDAGLNAQQAEADLSKLSKVFLSCIDQPKCQASLSAIADLYRGGDGVPKSTDTALSLYKALCAAHHGSSCQWVGSLQ